MPDIREPEQLSTGTSNEQQLYRDLVETSQDLIWQCDAEGRYTYLNPAWEKTFGYTVNEMLGKKFTDYQTPEQAEKDTVEFKRLMKGTIVRGLHTVHFGKDGRELHLVFNAIYIRDENGVICGTRGTAHDITGQVRVEEHLRESEERYRTVFDNAVEGLLVADAESKRFKYANPAVCKMFGYEPEEFAKLTVKDMHPADIIDDVLAAFEAGARNELKAIPTLPCLRKDGTVFYVGITSSIVQIRGRTCLVGFFTDVTERRKAEDALRASEERLRSIIDAAPFGAHMYELDADGRLVFTGANRSADRILGVEHNQFIGKTIIEAFPPLAATEIPERYAAVARDGETYSTEQVEYDHGGVKGAFDVRAVQTAPGRMAAFFRDITESKKAEEALRAEERKFRAIFNSSFQFIGLMTPDGILTEANESALQFAGTTREETINRPFWETRWWSGNEQRVQQLKEAIARCAKGEFVRYEVELQGAGATTAIVDFSLKPVVDAEGTVTMLVPEGRDITELKNAEILLINSQRLESLGILAGGIAHDFNNLLTGIFGSVELAALMTSDAAIKPQLATALTAMERTRDLTRQLLTFAKGGVPVRKPEAMRSFIEETVKFALSGSPITCRFDVPGTLWPCSIDRNQIGQVIDNIIINAEQAMSGSDSIAITARNVQLEPDDHPTLRKGAYVKISIADHGIGIPREILPKIFDPFFSTKEKGHGLGLAMCYSIIHRHEGIIDVESEPGRGSTFTLYLPASPETKAEASSSMGISYRGKGTVLIMDDEELIRKTVGEMLKTFGHSVAFVSSGEEAVAMLAGDENGFVAAILDLTVPGGMGGKDAAAAIRTFNSTIPIFVASGYDEDPVLAQPEKYGFTASIRKPFLVAELAALFERYL